MVNDLNCSEILNCDPHWIHNQSSYFIKEKQSNRRGWDENARGQSPMD